MHKIMRIYPQSLEMILRWSKVFKSAIDKVPPEAENTGYNFGPVTMLHPNIFQLVDKWLFQN